MIEIVSSLVAILLHARAGLGGAFNDSSPSGRSNATDDAAFCSRWTSEVPRNEADSTRERPLSPGRAVTTRWFDGRNARSISLRTSNRGRRAMTKVGAGYHAREPIGDDLRKRLMTTCGRTTVGRERGTAMYVMYAQLGDRCV